MTPLPLEEIGLRGRHHRSALWWLGLLYRRPKQLNDRLKELNKSQAAHASAVLYLHALPYIVLLSIIGRWLLFSVFGLELERSLAIYNISPILLHILFLITGIWLAMIIGVVFGLFALTNKWVIICVYIVGIVVIVMTGNIAIIGLLILLFSMVKNGSSFFKGLFCGFSLE